MSRSEGLPARLERRFHHRRAALGALLAASLLAACATPSPGPDARADSAGVREWAGRFAVSLRTQDPSGREEGGSGRFVLTATDTAPFTTLKLELQSPFGQVLASGRRAPDGRSTLTLADGRTLRGDSLDGVIAQALGWALPVERLTDWLDDRFELITARDAQGRVVSARDSGWSIDREPGRWALQRSASDGRLRVVLMLDR